MPVLLQYALEDGPITLYDIWNEPIQKTLDLIESWLGYCIVGFNCAFDWFHIVKIYTTFRLCPPDWIPRDHIDEIAILEKRGPRWTLRKAGGRIGSDVAQPQGTAPVPYGPQGYQNPQGANSLGICSGGGTGKNGWSWMASTSLKGQIPMHRGGRFLIANVMANLIQSSKTSYCDSVPPVA